MVIVNIPITFTDTSTGNISSSWNFGDGTPIVTGSPVSHTFSVAGTYRVTETITSSIGESISCFQDIVVTPPVSISCAISGCPSSIIQGQTMFIQPSFSGGLAPYSIQTLRDGVPYGSPISSPSTSVGQIMIPTDSSWSVGDHLVSFRITDSSSPQISCTTAACTISVTSPVTTGTLDVSSSPLGAEITIDTQDQGKVTRSIIQNIPAGDHLLTLTLSGYQVYTTTFSITVGGTTTLNPALTPVIPAMVCSFNYSQ